MIKQCDFKQFSVSYLFAHSLNIKQFYLTHRQDPIKCYQCEPKWTWAWWKVLDIRVFPKAPALLEPQIEIFFYHIQGTRCGGFLPFCWDEVGVFYSPSSHFSWYVSIFNWGACCYDELDFGEPPFCFLFDSPFSQMFLSFPTYRRGPVNLARTQLTINRSSWLLYTLSSCKWTHQWWPTSRNVYPSYLCRHRVPLSGPTKISW